MHDQKRNAWKTLIQKPEGRSHMKDLGIEDGWIILK
jgi:hypothetical protein